METSESADLINKLPPLLKDNDNSPESSAEKDTIISYVESLFSHKSVDTKDVNLWNDQPAIDPNTGVTRQFEKRMTSFLMDFAQKFGTVDSNAKFIARIKEMEANAVKIDDYETNPFIRLSKAVYDKHPEHVEAAIRDELGISGEISLEGVDLAALASGYPNCGPNDIVDSWDLSEVYNHFSNALLRNEIVFCKFKERFPNEMFKQKKSGVFELYRNVHGKSLTETAQTLNIKLLPQYCQQTDDTATEKAALDKKSVTESFNQKKYDDTLGLLDRFSNHLGRIAKDWNRAEYLAPYTAIVQSTGFGKSRLVCEYGRQRHFTFYICLRDYSSSSGYPQRSFIADYLLLGDRYRKPSQLSESTGLVVYYMSFVAACLQYLTMWVDQKQQQAKEFMDMQLLTNEGENVCGKEFWINVLAIWQKMFMRCLFAACKSKTLKDKAISAIGYARKLLESFAHQEQQSSPPILIAFDEAKSLLEPAFPERQSPDKSFFHHIRCAMYHVGEGSNLVFGILDTFAPLKDFLPDEIPDQSLRYITGTRLFDPFLIFGFPLPSSIPNAGVGSSNNSDGVAAFTEYGRYLWRSLNQDQLIPVAMYKLLCQEQSSITKMASSEQHLALLGSRLGIFIQANKKLAFQLVHSHCAMLTYSDSSRDSVFTCYPSEPLLAEIATRLTVNHAQFTWDLLIETLLKFVRTGVVDAGTRGELTARCMLLMAMDSVREQDPGLSLLSGDHFYSKPIKLRDFLIQLGTVELWNALWSDNDKGATEKQLKHLMNDCTVNFTHFIYVTYTPTVETARFFYSRYLAVFCRRNEVAIDLMIPYHRSDGQYSFILVQVKNYELASGNGINKIDDRNLSNMARKIIRIPKDDPVIYLFMQVGYSQPPEKGKLLMSNDAGVKGLYIQGISSTISPFLSGRSINDKRENSLKILSQAWADPRALYKTNNTGSDGQDFSPSSLLPLYSALLLNYPLNEIVNDLGQSKKAREQIIKTFECKANTTVKAGKRPASTTETLSAIKKMK